MSASRDLDPAAVERLHRLGGDKFLSEMIRLFLSYGREKLDEARAAQQAGDWEGVARAVHPIKSSAGNVGAARMQQLALEIEQHAKGRQADAVAAGLDALEAAFETVRPLLMAEQQRRTSEQS